MRAVHFDPSTLDGEQRQWWDDWQRRADTATWEAIAGFEQWLLHPPRDKPYKCAFRTEIWGELKAWMLDNLFFGKCAYCETRFTRSSGHAEHFRPKGSVLTSRKPKQRAVCEVPLPPEAPCGSIPHPGYFWLAYHWRNLVPACEFCNSHEGKLDLYPVSSGHKLLVELTAAERGTIEGTYWESPHFAGWFYLSCTGLDPCEQPLIINPLNPRPDYEPSRHLRFGALGVIAPVDATRIGIETIRTYNLDAEKLRQERQKAQELIRNRYFTMLLSVDDAAEARRQAEEKIRGFAEHREAYSTAALQDLAARLR